MTHVLRADQPFGECIATIIEAEWRVRLSAMQAAQASHDAPSIDAVSSPPLMYPHRKKKSSIKNKYKGK